MPGIHFWQVDTYRSFPVFPGWRSRSSVQYIFCCLIFFCNAYSKPEVLCRSIIKAYFNEQLAGVVGEVQFWCDMNVVCCGFITDDKGYFTDESSIIWPVERTAKGYFTFAILIVTSYRNCILLTVVQLTIQVHKEFTKPVSNMLCHLNTIYINVRCVVDGAKL